MTREYNHKKRIARCRFSFLAVSLIFALSACKSLSTTEKSISSPPILKPVTNSEKNEMVSSQVEGRAIVNDREMEGEASRCQRELQALAKVNPAVYAQKKIRFEKLLSQAAIYTGVRKEIDLQTKETIDALYKYKTRKLCSDIQQLVRVELINAGENIE